MLRIDYQADYPPWPLKTSGKRERHPRIQKYLYAPGARRSMKKTRREVNPFALSEAEHSSENNF